MQPKHTLTRAKTEFSIKFVILITFYVFVSIIYLYQNRIHPFYPHCSQEWYLHLKTMLKRGWQCWGYSFGLTKTLAVSFFLNLEIAFLSFKLYRKLATFLPSCFRIICVGDDYMHVFMHWYKYMVFYKGFECLTFSDTAELWNYITFSECMYDICMHHPLIFFCTYICCRFYYSL